MTIFNPIFNKFNYIFLIKNIELLKEYPILTPIIEAKILFISTKTMFKVVKMIFDTSFLTTPIGVALRLLGYPYFGFKG